MYDPDLESTNTKQAPNRIEPKILNNAKFGKEKLELILPAASWSIIRLSKYS